MVGTIQPAELAELLATSAIDLIDVRDEDEWASGHIPGARLVPLTVFRNDPDAVLKQGITIVFACAKGVRSMQAAKLAERFGYERVLNLEGGTKEWERLGLGLALDTNRVAA